MRNKQGECWSAHWTYLLFFLSRRTSHFYRVYGHLE